MVRGVEWLWLGAILRVGDRIGGVFLWVARCDGWLWLGPISRVGARIGHDLDFRLDVCAKSNSKGGFKTPIGFTMRVISNLDLFYHRQLFVISMSETPYGVLAPSNIQTSRNQGVK